MEAVNKLKQIFYRERGDSNVYFKLGANYRIKQICPLIEYSQPVKVIGWLPVFIELSFPVTPDSSNGSAAAVMARQRVSYGS